MTKYIIEIPDDVQYVLLNGKADNKYYTAVRPIAELEELNSDYINENFGELQDEAYQRGLEDAWEAARKIALMDTETSENVTGYFGLFRIMENLTPMQAIAKLKAYEEKQKYSIEVGDEVEWAGDKYVVTYLNYDIETSEITDYDLLAYDGSVVDHVKKCAFTKTGKHYDIQSILEAMRNDR
jgi:hypothetical protein